MASTPITNVTPINTVAALEREAAAAEAAVAEAQRKAKEARTALHRATNASKLAELAGLTRESCVDYTAEIRAIADGVAKRRIEDLEAFQRLLSFSNATEAAHARAALIAKEIGEPVPPPPVGIEGHRAIFLERMAARGHQYGRQIGNVVELGVPLLFQMHGTLPNVPEDVIAALDAPVGGK